MKRPCYHVHTTSSKHHFIVLCQVTIHPALASISPPPVSNLMEYVSTIHLGSAMPTFYIGPAWRMAIKSVVVLSCNPTFTSCADIHIQYTEAIPVVISDILSNGNEVIIMTSEVDSCDEVAMMTSEVDSCDEVVIMTPEVDSCDEVAMVTPEVDSCDEVVISILKFEFVDCAVIPKVDFEALNK